MCNIIVAFLSRRVVFMDTFINVRVAKTILSHKRNSLFPRCITKPQTLRLQDRQRTFKKTKYILLHVG